MQNKTVTLPADHKYKCYPKMLEQFPLTTITIPNGEEIAYYKAGNKENVLFMIHGIEGGVYNFDRLFPVATDYFTIIAPDLRGHGFSSYNKPLLSCEEFAEDLYLFAKELGYSKFSLYSWSFGCCITLKFAAMYPECVDKLILQGPMPITGLSLFKSEDGKKIEEIYDDLENLDKHPAIVNQVKRVIETQDREYYMKYMDGDFSPQKPDSDTIEINLDQIMITKGFKGARWALHSFNMSPKDHGPIKGKGDIEKVKAKTLFVCGEHDPFVKKEHIEEYQMYMKHVETTVNYFHDCGHGIHPFYPKELCELMYNFVIEKKK